MTQELQDALRKYSPVLSQVYVYYMEHLSKVNVNQCIVELFGMILDVAKSCVSEKHPSIVNPVGWERIYTPMDPVEERNRTGVFFPQWRYHSTIEQSGKQISDFKLEPDEGCFNNAKKNGRLGAGVLLFWCADHSMCLGWILMPSAESPRLVFDVLCSRFPKMPEVLIYDNACNLFEYSHNRAPALFKDTLFLSDGFHWLNHVNCSSSFDASSYRMLLKGIASVTHEIKNSSLAPLKVTAPFMRYDSFMETLTAVVANLNFRQKNYQI